MPAIRDQAARDAGAHGRRRWQQGYNLAQLIREICLIRNDVLEVWLDLFAREHAGFDRPSLEVVRKTVVRFFDDLVIESAVQFASEQIGEVRRVEAALSTVESSVRLAKSEILRHMSHDLREPLAAIDFAAQALSTDENLSVHSREAVQIIMRNTRIEADHVHQLLIGAELTFRQKSLPAS